MTAPLCIDCKHCFANGIKFGCLTALEETSVIDGRKTYATCETARKKTGVCGPEGERFERGEPERTPFRFWFAGAIACVIVLVVVLLLILT